MGCWGCREWWRVGGDSHSQGRGVSHWASLQAHSWRTTYQWCRYIPWRWAWPLRHGTIEWQHIQSWRCGEWCVYQCQVPMKVLLLSTLGRELAERARPKSQSCGMVRREEGELEMMHLEIAVGVEKIGWLEIAMKHVCWVKRLEHPQSL